MILTKMAVSGQWREMKNRFSGRIAINMSIPKRNEFDSKLEGIKSCLTGRKQK